MNSLADISQNTTRVSRDPRSFKKQMDVRKPLVAIISIALILRFISAFYLGNTVQALPGIYDQVSYHGLAQRVIAGHGFSFDSAHWPVTRAGEPTAHWSYLYTLYVAGVYALWGVNPLIARLIQAVLVSILHTVLIYRLGKHIFGQLTGLIAAALSAIYIYFFYYAGALMTEPFYIVAILWTLFSSWKLSLPPQMNTEHQQSRASLWLWFEFGLALGTTLLLRQVFLLFIPFLFLWIWWNKARTTTMHSMEPSPSRLTALRAIHLPIIKGFALTSIILAVMILPWTFRNYQAFGMFVPLNTNSGYALFWGNHPIYGTNFQGILPPKGPSYQELIPKELLPLNEAELDSALRKIGIGFITEDPKRFVLLSFSRAVEYFKFLPSSQSSMASNIARIGSFGIMLPFILYGLWVSIRDAFRHPTTVQRSGIILLLMFVIVYTGTHLLVWALIRYRLPVDAILLLFGAYGITKISGLTSPLALYNVEPTPNVAGH